MNYSFELFKDYLKNVYKYSFKEKEYKPNEYKTYEVNSPPKGLFKVTKKYTIKSNINDDNEEKISGDYMVDIFNDLKTGDIEHFKHYVNFHNDTDDFHDNDKDSQSLDDQGDPLSSEKEDPSYTLDSEDAVSSEGESK